jgi:ubiquinone biosynthesis protein UbiJ
MLNNLTNLLLLPAQVLLDRGQKRSTTAAALCERLEGRTFAISTGVEQLDVYFIVSDGSLRLMAGHAADADATLSGSPVNLARLASESPEALIRSGDVKISGDADAAANFHALLDIVRPDWEEELSHIMGDAIAHEAVQVLQGIAAWTERARRSLGRSVAEYLTEESRDLVAPTELEEFNDGVDQTSAAVDRLEAKLQRLQSQQSVA